MSDTSLSTEQRKLLAERLREAVRDIRSHHHPEAALRRIEMAAMAIHPPQRRTAHNGGAHGLRRVK